MPTISVTVLELLLFPIPHLNGAIGDTIAEHFTVMDAFIFAE